MTTDTAASCHGRRLTLTLAAVLTCALAGCAAPVAANAAIATNTDSP